MSLTLENLKEEIDLIKSRNQKVEQDKLWETSFTRKLSIAMLTYLVISIFFVLIQVKDPLVNAIVPTTGFLLSTLSLKFIKQVWLKNKNHKIV